MQNKLQKEGLQQRKKEERSYKNETWNVRALNQAELEYLMKEMKKNAVSVLRVNELRWKGKGEIRSGDYTAYYSAGEMLYQQ
jgi:hypothetical protein